MTLMLEKAIDLIRNLPDRRQDELAMALLSAAEGGVLTLSPEERSAVAQGLADIEAGRFASQADVDAIFARHRI